MGLIGLVPIRCIKNKDWIKIKSIVSRETMLFILYSFSIICKKFAEVIYMQYFYDVSFFSRSLLKRIIILLNISFGSV